MKLKRTYKHFILILPVRVQYLQISIGTNLEMSYQQIVFYLQTVPI